MKEKLEAEVIKKVHYFFIGKDHKKIVKKMDENLKYYRLEDLGKFDGKEIIYDVKSNMLSNAGLVLSKQYEGGEATFKVRKISTLPGEFKRPSKKFQLGRADDAEQPRDYALQIANAIGDSFSSAFTVDLVSVVRQTEPRIEILVNGQKYRIIGGTGYEAFLLYETAVYKDVASKKKVKRVGFTLKLPKDEKYDSENEEVMNVIEKYCKELVCYEASRFEIAKRLLYPDVASKPKKVEAEEESK